MDIASLTIKVVNEGLDAAAKGLGDLGDKAKTAQDRVDGFNKNMSGLRNVALGVGGSILGAGAAIVKVSGNFEAAMNSVKAVSGAAGDEFDALREKAKELGATTAFSASEAANGMEFLAMAGLNTQQVLETIPNALSLASAGSLDLATSADILSNIMSGMGLAAEESGRAADVLAATAAGANTDIAALGEAMKYVAPIAKTMGYSLEEASAAVGILGNAGIAAGQAGTSLRAIMTRIASDKGANETLKELGVATTDANGEMRSLTDILSELQTKTKELSSDSQIEIFKDIAGSEAMGALAVLVDGVANDSLPQLIDKLHEADGAAKAMADTKMEGFEGAMKGLASAGEALMIAIGESGLLDIVTDLTTRFADFVRQLADTNPEIFKTIGIVAGVVLAFSGLVLAIAGIGSVIGTAISAFTGMIAVAKLLVVGIGLLVSPIGLVVLGIAGLIAIGVALYKNWDTIKAKASELKDGIAQAWGQAVSSTQASWESIKSTVGQKAEQAKQVAINAFNSLPSPIKNILTIVYNVVKTQLDLVRNIFTTVLNMIKAAVRGDMQGVVDAFKTGMTNAWNIIKTGATNIVNAIKDLGARLFKAGVDAVQGLINGIKSKIAGVKAAASELGQAAWGGVKSFLQIRSPSRLMRQLGHDTVAGFVIGIKDKKSDAFRAAEQLAQATLDGITGLKKKMALFGNDSEVAAFDYDVEQGRYANLADSLIKEYREQLVKFEEMKAQADAQSKAKQLAEEQEQRAKEAGDTMSQMLGGLGGEKSPLQRLQDEQDERLRIIQESMIAEGGMKQAHTDAMLAIDERYEQDLQKLKLAQYGDGLGLFTRFMGSMLGENKRAKRIMFGIEKGFALASILIENKKALAKAWASAPFPYNMPIVAKTAMQTGAISAALNAINPKGFKQGGYTGSIGANNIAGVVHGNEYVFDAQSTKAIGAENLERIRRGKGTGEVNITVNNHSSAKVETETDSQGNIIMTIRDEVKRSWSNLQNPNSHESKMLGRNVQAPRRR